MKIRRSRDHPNKTSKQRSTELLTTVVSVLLLVGIIGAFTFSLDTDDVPEQPSDTPSANVPVTPTETVYDIDVALGSGKYAASEGVLTYTYEGDYTASGYDLGFTAGSITTVGGNAESSDSWTSVVDVSGNSVLEVGQDSETSGNALNVPSLNTTGERYVFETDIRWLGSEGGVNPEHDDDDPNWFFRIEFFGDEQSNGNTFYYDMFCMYKLGEDYFYLSNDHEVYDYEIKIKLGTWVNLRIEYVPVSDTTANVLIYVNDKLAAMEYGFQNKNDAGTVYSNSSFTKVQIENRGKCYDYVLQLDNTYVSAVGEAPSSGDNEADGSGPWEGDVDPNGWTQVDVQSIKENLPSGTWL